MLPGNLPRVSRGDPGPLGMETKILGEMQCFLWILTLFNGLRDHLRLFCKCRFCGPGTELRFCTSSRLPGPAGAEVPGAGVSVILQQLSSPGG